MYRRRVLGVALAAASSGCSTKILGEEPTPEVTVGQLEVSNINSSPHEVTLELYANDDLVYSETHSVSSVGNQGDAVIIERDWPANVEQYTFRGRVDGGEWRQFVFDESHANTCHIGVLHISKHGDYDIRYSTAGADEELCGARSSVS